MKKKNEVLKKFVHFFIVYLYVKLKKITLVFLQRKFSRGALQKPGYSAMFSIRI